ncbi:hypothetical protein BDB01DRAFT_781096 [Pilobolus umbonatus]|nr:hypothetical protein BDB01DRAFT_781096 [Pilobolus umbonatus]
MVNFRHLTPLDFENSSSQQRQRSIQNDDNTVDTLLSEESVLSIYSSDEEIVIPVTGDEMDLLIDEVEETIMNYYNDELTINEDYIDQMQNDVVETSNDIIEIVDEVIDIVEDVLEVEEEDLIYMDAIDDIEDNHWNRTVEVPLMTTRQLFLIIVSEDTTIRYLHEKEYICPSASSRNFSTFGKNLTYAKGKEMYSPFGFGAQNKVNMVLHFPFLCLCSCI